MSLTDSNAQIHLLSMQLTPSFASYTCHDNGKNLPGKSYGSGATT